jgi:hypothetical protein
VNDQVIGRTADHLNVLESYGTHLGFTLFSYGRIESNRGAYIAVEWQSEGNRKRPYLIFQVGPHMFQCGWLFG